MEEKAREDMERKTREIFIHMVEVFKNTASLLATEIMSARFQVPLSPISEMYMGEGLEPSLLLNQKADQPISSIYGLGTFYSRYNMLEMETVLAVQRENRNYIGK